MIIETKFFGPKEIDASEMITFKQGIPGFENLHRYVLLKYRNDSPFLIMQSVDSGELALIVIPLVTVVPNYSIDLSDDVAAELKLAKPEDAAAVAVVVLPADIAQATVNLAAPIIINQQEHLAKQVILDHPAYGLKHPLFQAEAEPDTRKKVVNGSR